LGAEKEKKGRRFTFITPWGEEVGSIAVTRGGGRGKRKSKVNGARRKRQAIGKGGEIGENGLSSLSLEKKGEMAQSSSQLGGAAQERKKKYGVLYFISAKREGEEKGEKTFGFVLFSLEGKKGGGPSPVPSWDRRSQGEKTS